MSRRLETLMAEIEHQARSGGHHGTRILREIPAQERPRERLAARGVGGLATAALIVLVWGSGTRGRSAVDLASDALARHDGLTGLARATEVELAEVRGIGEAKGGQLPAGFRPRRGWLHSM